MDLLSPTVFWPTRDGLPATFPSLRENLSCDVAVIGAGISGALIGWRLAEAGLDTVLIDRREVAHGSTAGNTGLLLYELDEPLHRLARRFGVPFAVRAYRRCAEAVAEARDIVQHLRLDCDFTPRPSLYVAANARHVAGLKHEFAARDAAGLAVEWWPRSRIARESSLPYPSAIWSRDAAQIDAYRFTYGVLGAAERAGARIFDRTAITRRLTNSKGVELNTSYGALVRAKEVVIASGYEADAGLPQSATHLQSTFAWVSAPLRALPGWPADGCMIWETSEAYLYLRTLADGRVMIGGYDEPFRDPRKRDQLLPRKTAALLRRFRALFPDIPVEVEYAWAGTFGTTDDGLPFIGRHARVPRTHFALGYGGNGITFSLIASEIIRDALLGRRDRDADIFGFERLTR